MTTSFLDYYKLVLDKVSFEQELFRKEYHKAMGSLLDPERDELNKWLSERGYATRFNRDGYKVQSANLPMADFKNSTVLNQR
jgi:hypothetical protein